jgi:hypothetical protein
MGLRYDTITFLSDYGLTDEFVGLVHSVIRSITPDAHVIDLTHQIPPYDVRAGGLALARSVQYLCPGVVLAVVDPGVATARPSPSRSASQSVLIDLTTAAAGVRAGRDTRCADNEYHLPAPGASSPAATSSPRSPPTSAPGCRSTAGTPSTWRCCCPACSRSATPTVTTSSARCCGSTACNAINIDPDEIAGWGDRVRLHLNDQTRTGRVVASYRDVGPNEIGLVVDSYGLLSIALDQQSAASQLGLGPETAVRLSAFADDEQESGVTTAVQLTTRRDPADPNDPAATAAPVDPRDPADPADDEEPTS